MATRTFDSAKGRNENYWVKVSCQSLGVEIIADMPEETTTAVGSEWEGFLPASIGSVSNAAETIVKTITGSGAVYQYNTQQIWVNSSPMEIPITLQFDTTRDAAQDVYIPMRLLELMALPREAGGFLYSPGTNSGLIAGGDSSISLHIGKHLNIPRVIVVSVNSSFDSRLDKNGYPISGRSDITFRTDRVLSIDDWKKYTGVS